MEILCQIFVPKVLCLLGLPIAPFLAEFLTSDVDADVAHITTSPSAIYALTMLNSPTVASDSLLYRAWKGNQRDHSDSGVQLFDQLHDEIILPPNTVPANASAADREWRRKVIASIDDMHMRVGITEYDFRRLHLPSLYRRVVNADPNYGVEWFYCRKKSTDNPLCILESARSIMTREMLECQHVYTRAALHFIESSCRKSSGCPQRRRGKAPSAPPTMFDRWPWRQRTAAARTSKTCFRVQPPCLRRGGRDGAGAASRALGSAEDQRTRMTEFFEDCRDARQPLASPDNPNPDLEPISASGDLQSKDCAFDRRSVHTVEAGGMMFLSSDFVSSLVCLNRTQFNRTLKDEGRRYVLYGSDSIL